MHKLQKKKKLYTSVNQDKGHAEIEWRGKEKKKKPTHNQPNNSERKKYCFQETTEIK